jgi:hypothetical protein
MPTPLIDESRFDEIRHAIDTSLGPTNLPNEIIASDLCIGQAIRWVEARTTDRGAYAKLAAIYYAAWLIVPSVPRVKIDKESSGSSTQVEVFDLGEKMAQLLGRAEEYISEVEDLTPTAAASPPAFFTLAKACRGR